MFHFIAFRKLVNNFDFVRLNFGQVSNVKGSTQAEGVREFGAEVKGEEVAGGRRKLYNEERNVL